MAIGFDDYTDGWNMGASTLTMYLTLATSNILIVFVTTADAKNVASITYNGDALSFAAESLATYSPHTEMWYLVNPDLGAEYDIDITLSGSSTKVIAMGMGLTGVDTADPIGDWDETGVWAAAVSADVTTTVDGSWICSCCGLLLNTGITPHASQTEVDQSNTAGAPLMSAEWSTELIPDADLDWQSWTWVGNGDARCLAVEIKPQVVAGAVGSMISLMGLITPPPP